MSGTQDDVIAPGAGVRVGLDCARQEYSCQDKDSDARKRAT